MLTFPRTVLPLPCLQTEVALALMQQLGKNSFDGAHMGPDRPAVAKAAAGLEDCLDPLMTSGDGQGETLQQLQQQQEDNNARCQTLRGALHFIMVPEPEPAPAAHCSPLSTSACCSPMHATATAEGSGNACTDPRDTPAASGSEGPHDLSHLVQQQLGQGAAKAPRVPPQQQLQHYRHHSMLTRMGYSLSGHMASGPPRLAGGGSAAAGSAYPRLHRLSNIQLPVAKSAARRRSYGPSTASVRPLDADAWHANVLHGRVGRTLGLGPEAPTVGTKTRRGASLDQTAVLVEGDQPVAAPLSGSGCLLLLQARASADNSPPQSHAQRTSDNRAACLLMTAPSYAAMMAARASAESQEAGAHNSSGRGDGWPVASGGTQEDEVEVDVTESDEAVVAAPPSAAMLDEVGTRRAVCAAALGQRVQHRVWLAACTDRVLTAVCVQAAVPLVSASIGRCLVADHASAALVGLKPQRTGAPCAVQVERLLGHVDGLRYDTWALDAATGGHALSAMGFFLLQREGLLARFSVPPVKLVRWAEGGVRGARAQG